MSPKQDYHTIGGQLEQTNVVAFHQLIIVANVGKTS